MKKNIVIIGGCGYVGSFIYTQLKDIYKVDTVDLEWFGNYINPNNFCVDYEYLEKKFWDKYDAIILLAGHSSVQMSTNGKDTFNNNVFKFINLLNKLNNKVLIFASSSSIYNGSGSLSVPETWDRFIPSNYYDLSKKCLDLYFQCFESNNKIFSLRMGTVNGWSINFRKDIMINAMMDYYKSNGCINIFNSEISRPILGISDFARCCKAIIEKPIASGIYNLASFNMIVGEIAKRVSVVLGNISVIDKGQSAIPPYNFSIDTSKFEKEFDFKFEETVESIVNSLVENWDNCKNKMGRI